MPEPVGMDPLADPGPLGQPREQRTHVCLLDRPALQRADQWRVARWTKPAPGGGPLSEDGDCLLVDTGRAGPPALAIEDADVSRAPVDVVGANG